VFRDGATRGVRAAGVAVQSWGAAGVKSGPRVGLGRPRHPSARRIAERVGVAPGALVQWRVGTCIPTLGWFERSRLRLPSRRALLHAVRHTERLDEGLVRLDRVYHRINVESLRASSGG
jgi:hypothetical protein